MINIPYYSSVPLLYGTRGKNTHTPSPSLLRKGGYSIIDIAGDTLGDVSRDKGVEDEWGCHETVD
jgi:hypothetical protein